MTLTSEDCLYLNLWHPAASGHDGPLPVIVWFYGGGFESPTCGLRRRPVPLMSPPRQAGTARAC
ncbi:carboxylesterase family protein [Actinospica durhamensis]|uniref:carboxylesterase family protein n=1 Tax=Actinospica durhamensis TaxID=1508375 RepID=UPI003F682355